jgi:hypothetical protein
MGTFRNGNFIGRNIIKFRNRKNWTQEIHRKIAIQRCRMTREIIANIEDCRCPATQK